MSPQLVVATATAAVLTRLVGLAKDPQAFHTLVADVYGSGYDVDAAEDIRLRLAGGDFSWFPNVFAASDDVLGGAIGAYDREGNALYLSEQALRNPATAARAMAEELGHHFDTIFSTTETAGDEGELFRRLLAGEALSPEQLEAIQSQVDQGTIVVGGRAVPVEFWYGSSAVNWVKDKAEDAGEWVGDKAQDAGEWVSDDVVDPASEWVNDNGTEILGGLQAVGGAVEVGMGIAVGAAAGWTGGGAVLGGILITHGLDNARAGIETAATGSPTASYTQQVATAAGEALGMSPEDAQKFGIGVNTLVGVAGGAAAGGVLGGAGSFGSSISVGADGTLAVVAGVEITASATGGAAGALPGVAGGAAAMVGGANGGGRAPEFPSGQLTESQFFEATERFLGPGYREVSPGRFVSADGTRQVRYGAHEVRNPGNHHAHFEVLENGRVVENAVVQVVP